jgi:anthranilate phosphoribosyltransferase
MDALIRHLEEGLELSPREVEVAASLLLDAAAPDEKKERLLEALATKGETPAEIATFVEAFLEHAIDPELGETDGPTLDVCGTGGDKLDLFNVSTTSMFIAAAAGATVVKHGNRGITSQSGGADVLEALGIRTDLPPDGFRRCIEAAGVGFLFAPTYHCLTLRGRSASWLVSSPASFARHLPKSCNGSAATARGSSTEPPATVARWMR